MALSDSRSPNRSRVGPIEARHELGRDFPNRVRDESLANTAVLGGLIRVSLLRLAEQFGFANKLSSNLCLSAPPGAHSSLPPIITMAPPPTIEVNDLTYTFPDQSTGISHITLSVPARSRTLLIGANGAGKTTLLRLLAGKRLAPRHSIAIGGLDPFADGLEGVTYLGLEWVLNPVVRTDVGVAELLKSVGGNVYHERRDELVAVLDVDTAWRMHAVSDGERRRVQLAMGLLRPWTVLLLDEITVDLDVWSRARFLGFLKRETENRECTIVYATHILDNLAGWPTHLVHMHLGMVKEWGLAEGFVQEMMEVRREGKEEKQELEEGLSLGTGNSVLGQLVLRWLRQDLIERGPRSQNRRGPEGRSYYDGGIGGYGLEKMPEEE
jgi:CCR4-NOT complex subunit CAF16